MNVLLSIENTFNWSWGLVFDRFITELRDKYSIDRMVRRRGQQISADGFDAVLVQNVDSIPLVDDKKKVISRMGGMRTKGLGVNPHVFDEELSQVGAVIATNKELFHISVRNNPHTYLIPNGIDLDTFYPAPVEHGSRQFTVGFAGNINGGGLQYKGWHLYAEVVQRLYGEIKTKEVLFGHSQIPHESMPKEFYHQIDCLILPTTGEGSSNVIMEALACGVPVLCTKVGYHGEMLTDRENCLFIERDVMDIMGKLKTLMYDVWLRRKLATNGRIFAEQNHDIRVIAAKYDEIFQKVIRSNKNG